MHYIGLWIDHKQAIIVDMNNNGEMLRRIPSHADSKIRLSGGYGGATPYAPQDVASERRLERRRKLQLHKYYQRVIRNIRQADGIVIMGPGQAKIELVKEMRSSNDLSKKILGVEAANRMTDSQLRARLRNALASRLAARSSGPPPEGSVRWSEPSPALART